MQVSITYLGVDLEVEGTYEPEEPSKLSGPPEDCYEGGPSYFEIEDILVGGVSIYEMFQCFAICTNKSPIGHTDALNDLAALVCEICDNMEPDYDDAE
jgi:hypothetical protein